MNRFLPTLAGFQRDRWRLASIFSARTSNNFNTDLPITVELLSHRILIEMHYPVPSHRQKALHGIFDIAAYPLADKIHTPPPSLPISICHSEEDMSRVIAVMNRFRH